MAVPLAFIKDIAAARGLELAIGLPGFVSMAAPPEGNPKALHDLR
jgi:hypothetical protein